MMVNGLSDANARFVLRK